MRKHTHAIPVGFAAALAAYWLVYLRGTRPSLFGDSVRYFDVEAGWTLASRLDLHQGAFLPVVLFQAAGDTHGIFLINSLMWIVSWTILSAAIARRCDPARAWVVHLAVLLLATTSQVVGWLGAVLTESLTTSMTIVVVAAAIAVDGTPAWKAGRFPWMIASASGLLFVTRPFMLLALAPLVVLVMKRRQLFKTVSGVLGVPIAAALVIATVVVGGSRPYADGLTFNGWYALTRAVHLSQDRALSRLTTEPFLSCAAVNAAVASSIARGYGMGLVPEFGDALRACPQQVEWLNSTAPGVGRLLLDAPVPTIVALAGSAEWIAKPAVYPSHLLGYGTWGQGTLHRLLTPWETGPYLLVTFGVLTWVWTRGISGLGALSGPLLVGVVAVGALAVFTDGIEQGRHVSAFNVLSLLAMALSLDLSRTAR